MNFGKRRAATGEVAEDTRAAAVKAAPRLARQLPMRRGVGSLGTVLRQNGCPMRCPQGPHVAVRGRCEMPTRCSVNASLAFTSSAPVASRGVDPLVSLLPSHTPGGGGGFGPHASLPLNRSHHLSTRLDRLLRDRGGYNGDVSRGLQHHRVHGAHVGLARLPDLGQNVVAGHPLTTEVLV